MGGSEMIIGLCGSAGAGKDTIADHLVRDHGFVKIGLADEIKRTAKRWYDFTDEQLWGPSEMRNAPDKRFLRSPEAVSKGGPVYLTPRFVLQFLGTEAGRMFYPNTWIDITLRTAKTLFIHNQSYSPQLGIHGGGCNFGPGVVRGVVIPDVRFRNEVDAIQTAGGLVARVLRPSAGLAGAAGQHVSETEQSELPDDMFLGGIIDNQSDIPKLHETVDLMVHGWRHGWRSRLG